MKYFTVKLYENDRIISILAQAKSKNEATINVDNVIECVEITKAEYKAFKSVL